MNRWWSLGRLGGVPVRVHWSIVLGALIFTSFRLAPGAWLGFLVIILAHELGHAAVVRWTRQRVLGIDIHALGGECRWYGNATPLQRSAIAWGGVWAQLALFVAAIPVMVLFGARLGSFGYDLFYQLTWGSLWLAALNLVPVRPLDGVEAWKLPGLLRERSRLRAASRPKQIKGSTSKGQPAPELPPELREVFANLAKEARDARRGRP
ncbi:MAG: hypothetical protein U0271_21845 [Polyangiaceae bacterium]